MSIFKPCDLRGVYGQDLTDEAMDRIGRGIATMLVRDTKKDHPSVLVAGDVRTSTPALKDRLIGGLVSAGASVVDIGTVPTPLFYLAFAQGRTDGCATVTASHNPPEFNGLKLCISPKPIRPEDIRRLADLVERQDFEKGQGTVRREDFGPRYDRFIRETFRRPIRLRVAVDAGNGCYSLIAPRLMADLGMEVTPIFCEPDGRFPNRSPNPAYIGLEALCDAVRGKKADYGIAFDGDGDRVIFVDDLGRKVSNDKAIVLLGRHVFAAQARPGVKEKAVYEVNCSRIVPEQIVASGGIPLVERAGHAFIKTRMLNEDALYGGEISGHFFYRALHGGDDGLYSGILLGEAILREKKPLSQLVDEVPSYHISPVVRMPCSGDEANRIVEEIASSASPSANVSRVDGVRIEYPNGWGLARTSVTEPVISMRFEAVQESMLEGIVRDFLRPVPRVLEFALKTLSAK